MSPLLNALAASSYIDTVKARAKSLPGNELRFALGDGVQLFVKYDPPKREQDAVIPELCWRWTLSTKAGDQSMTEGEALAALMGEMPKAAMSGEAVFALIARNSENVRG